MFGTICKQEYGRYTVRTPFGLVVIMVLISMLSSSAVANRVTGVEIYAGRSFTEAHDQIHDGKTLYIAAGCTVYFCGVVGNNRTDNDLIYRWDFQDGTVQYDRDHDDYHEHIAHTYSTPIVYEPSLKVWPEGSSGDGAEVDDDECTIEVVEVKLYINYDTKVLDDWIHSPRYIFGRDDPIYVQVKGLGTDPYVAECITQAVQVISESDTSGNIYLNLCETGENTQIFRNSLAVGELLYLADFSASMGSGDRIKVMDEEVLTFKLRCPLVGAISSYEDSTDVMVDRAEVGVEWQGAYWTYDNFPTLSCADDFADGFYDNLGSVGLVWFKNFNNGDLVSKESHWDAGGDLNYTDSVDFAVWCGHATVDADGHYMRFFVDLDGGVKQPADKLYWSEIDWGDADVDWVALNTCRYLDGNDTELKQMASGVHLICGYKTRMTVYCIAGEFFADMLYIYDIKNAWHDQCDEYQNSGNTSRVFGASDCMMEYIGYLGPKEVRPDPTVSSSYTHSDYTKP